MTGVIEACDARMLEIGDRPRERVMRAVKETKANPIRDSIRVALKLRPPFGQDCGGVPLCKNCPIKKGKKASLAVAARNIWKLEQKR